MKVYAGYTGNVKNVGEGFYNRAGISANIKVAEITADELDVELDEVAWAEGYRARVAIPENLIGGAYGLCGSASILCKSLAQAQQIVNAKPSRNEAIMRAEKDGWRINPNAAAKDAMTKLIQRAEDREARQSFTRESATAALITANIFPVGWEISERVWKKSLTKIRVQNALAGDSNAIGCLRRDAKK